MMLNVLSDPKLKLELDSYLNKSVTSETMPMECYNGRVTLSPGTDTLQLPASLLPESRCQSQTGLCFSSLTRVQGVTVLSLGCWPSQHHLQLAWYGVPECKNEVN